MESVGCEMIDVMFFQKYFDDFQKRTFINVHFRFFISRFEKNVENLTQTIMLSFAFLS